MEQTPGLSGAIGLSTYRAAAPAARPADHDTPRIIATHPDARTPTEAALVRWQR